MGQSGRLFLIDEDRKGYLFQVKELSEADWSVERSQCDKLRALPIPPSDEQATSSAPLLPPTVLHASCCGFRTEIVDSLNRAHVHIGPVLDSGGIPTLMHLPTPKFKVLRVACAPRHTLLCTSSGVVLSRGCKSKGRMGIHDPDSNSSEAEPVDWEASPFMEVLSPSIRHAFINNVFASGANSIALTDRGKLFSWGDHSSHLLGFPSNNHCIYEPRLIGGLGEVKISKVSLGAFHALAVSDSGNVYGCGHLPRTVHKGGQGNTSDSKTSGLRRRSPQTVLGNNVINSSSDKPSAALAPSTTPVTNPTLMEFFATQGMAIGGAWAARKSSGYVEDASVNAVNAVNPVDPVIGFNSSLSHSLFATTKAVVTALDQRPAKNEEDLKVYPPNCTAFGPGLNLKLPPNGGSSSSFRLLISHNDQY